MSGPEIVTEHAWLEQARCKRPEHAHVNFFPARGESTKPAKQVCGLCPVRPQCLDDALTNGELFGVWGGMSERERQPIRVAIATQARLDAPEVPPTLPTGDHRHGTLNGYKHHGCRCDRCRYTWSEYSRERRARRSAS